LLPVGRLLVPRLGNPEPLACNTNVRAELLISAMPPRVLILRAPGTNCDGETAFAFERAGAQTDLHHVNRLLEHPRLLADYQILCLPGGFSYGDDIASGRILANLFRHHLADELRQFKSASKLILGICNGFQVMLRAGLLLDDDPVTGPPATLTWNESRRFEDRWVHLRVDGTRCVFLEGMDRLELPVAHGEGRFVTRDAATLQHLDRNGQLVLRYCPPPAVEGAPGEAADEPSPVPYPYNPNGSQLDVAGVCDPTGRVFGLMPHPERHIDRTQHPRWTRGEAGASGQGLRIFENAVAYFR
jgi:phosphoribosylformylglycinamidine synthase I